MREMIEKRPFSAVDVWKMKGCVELTLQECYDSGLIHEKREPNVSFWIGEECVACGGALLHWQGMAEGWTYVSRSSGPYVVREIRGQILEWMDKYRLHRFQTVCRSGWEKGERFLQFLGMQYEGRLRQFFPDKTDGLMYARIAQ